MVLDKLHVLQWSARAIGEPHAVAGLDAGVGGEGKNAAAATGAKDDGFGGDGLNLAGHKFDGHDALHAAIVHQELGDKPFVVTGDGVVFQSGLKESVQHVEAGFVGGKPRAHLFHAAESADGDVSVGLAAPRAAPMLEAQQFFGGFLDEGLHGVLVAEPVAAGNGVVGVLVETVTRFNDTRCAAFRRNRVAPHGVDLGDHGDVEFGIDFGDSDGCPEARPATSDQENVVVRYIHSNKRRTLWAAGNREPAAVKQA